MTQEDIPPNPDENNSKARKTKSPAEIFTANKLAWHEGMLSDGELSSSDTRVGGILMHLFRFDRGGTAWASIATYAERTTLSEKTVRAAIQNLQRRGWIVVNKGRRGLNGTNRIEPVFGRDARQDAVKNDTDPLSPPLTPPLTPPIGGPSSETLDEAEPESDEAEVKRAECSENSRVERVEYGTSSELSPVQRGTVPNQFPTTGDAVKNDQRCGKIGSEDAVKNDPRYLYESFGSPLRAREAEEKKGVDREEVVTFYQVFGPRPRAQSYKRSIEECARVMLLDDFNPSDLPAEISETDRETMEPVSHEVEEGSYSRMTSKRLKLVALALIQERRQSV